MLIFVYVENAVYNTEYVVLVFFVFFDIKLILFHEHSFWKVLHNSKNFTKMFFLIWKPYFIYLSYPLLTAYVVSNWRQSSRLKDPFRRSSMLSDTWHMPLVMHCLGGDIELYIRIFFFFSFFVCLFGVFFVVVVVVVVFVCLFCCFFH